MGSVAVVGNDLRVGNQLLYSKSKNKIKTKSSIVATLKTQSLLIVSNAEKAYKPR